MPYSDNNPERRNLTVLSLAIIVFYIGGGDISGSTINLPLINITFSNKSELIAFIWVMLFWFLFRYVVTNRNPYGKALDEYKAYTNMSYPFVEKIISISVGPNPDLKQVAIFKDINNKWKLQVGRNDVRLTGIKGYLIIKLYLLKVFFKHRATSDYYAPYFLFLVAVGAYNFIEITPDLIKYFYKSLLASIAILLLYLSAK